MLWVEWLWCCGWNGCDVVGGMVVVLWVEWLWCCGWNGCGVVGGMVVVLWVEWLWCCGWNGCLLVVVLWWMLDLFQCKHLFHI